MPSFLADAGRGILSGFAAWAREGREAIDFRLLSFSTESRFADVEAEGWNGVGMGEDEVDEAEGSTVRDFLNGTGFGAMIGGGLLELLNCHLSRTEPFRGVSLSFSGVAAADGLALDDDDVPSWLLALIIF